MEIKTEEERGAMALARALQRAEDNAELAEPVPRARGNRCHMVPLTSRASLEGDVGHDACTRVCVSVGFCACTCSRYTRECTTIHTYRI